MTRRAPAARFLLLALPVFLCAGQQQPLQQPGSVSGQVTNANSGEPVASATVHLVPLRYVRGGDHSQPQASSGPDGAFHFNNVAPGLYALTAEHAGFVPNKLNSKSEMVTVTAGQTVTGVAISLTPQGVISGVVTDDNGTPLPGAVVEALAPFTTRGQTSLKVFANCKADAQGKFELTGLPANSYYVLAKVREGKPTKDGDLVLTFYPRSLDIDGAGSVPVGAGETASDIAVRVRRTATFHIRGKIADGGPPSEASKFTVTLTPKGAANAVVLQDRVTVSPDRTFDISGVTPGVYTLRLTSETATRWHVLLARQEVEVGGGDVSGIVLSVMPPLSITGQVQLDSSSNAALPAVTVIARPLEEVSHASQGFARTSSDGTFTFNNLDPGPYIFQAHPAAPGWYVKAMTLNQQDVLNKPADLSEMSSARLDVVVSPNGGQVTVTVQADGSDAGLTDAGNTIVLAPESVGPDGSGVLFGFAQQNQSFSFRNVPPGKYFCFAVQRGDPNLWQNPDFLSAAQSLGTSVEVVESGTAQTQVRVIPLEQVEQVAARVGFRVE